MLVKKYAFTVVQFSMPAVFEATELDFLAAASVVRSYHSCILFDFITFLYYRCHHPFIIAT